MKRFLKYAALMVVMLVIATMVTGCSKASKAIKESTFMPNGLKFGMNVDTATMTSGFDVCNYVNDDGAKTEAEQRNVDLKYISGSYISEESLRNNDEITEIIKNYYSSLLDDKIKTKYVDVYFKDEKLVQVDYTIGKYYDYSDGFDQEEFDRQLTSYAQSYESVEEILTNVYGAEEYSGGKSTYGAIGGYFYDGGYWDDSIQQEKDRLIDCGSGKVLIEHYWSRAEYGYQYSAGGKKLDFPKRIEHHIVYTFYPMN